MSKKFIQNLKCNGIKIEVDNSNKENIRLNAYRLIQVTGQEEKAINCIL